MYYKYADMKCVCVSLGGDATEAFEDVGHSPDAREIQQTYLIGEIIGQKSSSIGVSAWLGRSVMFNWYSVQVGIYWCRYLYSVWMCVACEWNFVGVVLSVRSTSSLYPTFPGTHSCKVGGL